MSFLPYPDALDAPELQVWNNAAFDNGESEESAAIKASSWLIMNPDFLNLSLESCSSKENQSPGLVSPPVLRKSGAPIKPLHSNNTVNSVQAKPLKSSFEASSGKSRNGKEKEGNEEKKRGERTIDLEIEEIEKEISRLTSKLEMLRFEKAEQTARSIAMKGRIVPAKFLEQKQSIRNLSKKTEESIFSSGKGKIFNRRGVSLGPAEIFSKSKQLGKQETITPVQLQSRRKSCFWKLEDIDQEKIRKERGKSLSLSPKSRSKIHGQKQAATTVGSKRSVKKEDGLLTTIQPKKLFKDGEKSVKKPLKPGRIVASRYSQINGNNGNSSVKDARKRSLPENDKEESTRGDKRRASNENSLVSFSSCRNQKSESRVKKRWEIPAEGVVFKLQEAEEMTPSIANFHGMLPKIRTLRLFGESPRDSGPAKRVAELAGRKSYFCNNDDEDESDKSVFQALSFAMEDGDDYQV
ncbi:uncharacterized protein LOC110816867 [Carica papaya]|uniref:uncharacterized protein LOC110816867 n=1 Tax=Carica papaya TaxID=3649 RepID=UPI000B8CAF4C|nr:uncharacterized protein LOC110816867 [Carica papaya]